MRPFTLPASALAAAALFLLHPLRAPAQEIDPQLEEVRRLVAERNYTTALEDLKFIAQQIQELRLAGIVHLFPSPPSGWSGEPPVRTSLETDLWSRRLEARKTYRPDGAGGKLDIILDFASPLIPSVKMSMNPAFVAGDPRLEPADFEGGPGLISFNSDTGEGEAVFIIDNRILVTVVGRGIESRAVLREFASLLDYALLRSFHPR